MANGILFEQHAILEGAGLRFVGIADEEVRPGRLARHRLPLPAGRKRRAAAAQKVGRDHFLDRRQPDPSSNARDSAR